MRPRTSRTARRPERGLTRLTDRDVWILEALGRMRFLTTKQIARLAFNKSSGAAQKRLRQLLNTGLVRVWMRDLARDNIYSLTEIGGRLLGPPPTDNAWPAPRGLDRQLDHLILINDVRIAFVHGLLQIGGELQWWRSDWELRQQAREHLIPDAVFKVGWNGAQAYALEVDNATRAIRPFIAKILRYKMLFERGVYGLRGFITLVVGRDEAFLDRCRAALVAARIELPCWFTSTAAIEEQSVLDPIWISLSGERGPTLPGLDTPPYRKEAAPPPTP